VGEFFFGLILAGIGCYLLFDRVHVQTGWGWHFGGTNSFGISLIPCCSGWAMLFLQRQVDAGWILTVGGLLFIVVGIVANMDIYFYRTTLLNTLIMLVLWWRPGPHLPQPAPPLRAAP
jgi:hypothetical protein